MIGILNQATNLFQQANKVRQANESAMGLFEQWQDDLRQRVSISDGGLFWLMGTPEGNTIAAWTVQEQEMSQFDAARSATSPLSAAQRENLLGPALPIVVWWVDAQHSATDYQSSLHRGVITNLGTIASIHAEWNQRSGTNDEEKFIDSFPRLQSIKASTQTMAQSCLWFQVAAMGIGSEEHEPARRPIIDGTSGGEHHARRWRER